MSQVNHFEEMLTQSGTYLIKFYFSISKREQAKRFAEIRKSPLKRWKMTAVDEKAQRLWNDYTFYKKAMLEATHTVHAPWVIVDANVAYNAQIKAMSHILSVIPYS